MAISKNQLVEMHFEIKVKDTLIDNNFDKDPVKFKYGSGEILPAIEERISKLNAGDTKEFTIPSIEAYGEYDPELSETLPIEDFEGIDLELGMVLEADGEKGEIIKATVTEVTKETVTVDYNHPFAGCDLDFKILIKSIA